MRSNCAMAILVPRIRWPAPPLSPPSISILRKISSRGLYGWNHYGPRPCIVYGAMPNVLDIRNAGLTAAIDLAGRPGAPGKRGFEIMDHAFHDFNLLVRIAGDTLILTPPLIVSEAQIDEIVAKTAQAIKAAA